jgi:toxin CptA
MSSMSTATFFVGLLAVGLAGFATQRGNICTVVAVEQVVRERRYGRLVSLVEASAWVAAGLLVARLAGLLSFVPHGYIAGASTVAGGGLLGVGAIINRACAFGSVARLSSGDLAYFATPVGFLSGISGLHHWYSPAATSAAAPLLEFPVWMVAMITLLPLFTMGVRVWLPASKATKHEHGGWSPYVATAVIGLSFLVGTICFDHWTYMDLLGDLFHRTAQERLVGLVLATVLIAGAVLGGYVGGTLNFIRPTLSSLSRCLAGGAVMGVAAGVIPGGNAAPVQAEMPLLWPYAWLAFASMCVAVMAAVLLEHSSLGPSA